MEQIGITINVQLVAKKAGNYTVYIFKNLETLEYITVTKCPNWADDEVDVGQEGFLTYKFVRAFKETWINKNTGEEVFYQYSANYYLSFIPQTHVIKNGSIITKELYVT